MLNTNDAAYLFRALRANRVVLFAGAGFSIGAKNSLGEGLPGSDALARALWAWLAFPEPYDGTSLSELFEAALRSGRPVKSLQDFLERRLLVTSVPSWYDTAALIYWYRVYTTNVDDVLEKVYARVAASPRLVAVSGTQEDFSERDQFLAAMQYVKLNGTLPGDPNKVTFSTRQYARRAAQHDVWYDHFVRDYAFHPTVFIGTELREPLLWQAVEARQMRGRRSEERPQSFLVAPTMSAARSPILKELNVTHIPASGEEFFGWLSEHYDFPTRDTTVRLVAPEASHFVLDEGLSRTERNGLIHLFEVFPQVPNSIVDALRHRLYFTGVAPRWEDIANDYDAPRDLTTELRAEIGDALKNPSLFRVLGIVGPAGSGKSTVLMRLALLLRQEGHLVLFAEGGARPDLGVVCSALEKLGDRAVLFIDNAHLFGRVLNNLLHQLAALPRPPVVVFASRANVFERYLKAIENRKDAKLFQMSDLSDREIRGLLAKLEQHAQLGKLAAKTQAERVAELRVRARKQILVAMREATSGLGFDEIVRNEYAGTEGVETRTLFLCAAIATAELLDLSREQWLACAEVSIAEALEILHRNLKGMLFEYRERVAARHPIVADLIISRYASRQDLREAYVRVLNALAHDIYGGRGRTSRTWRLFLRLIDHQRLFDRFSGDVDLARSIYREVEGYFRDDGHFWLQYANLELAYGDVASARTHLAYAEAAMPDHAFVLTTRAHLILRDAHDASNYDEARALAAEGMAILRQQINASGPQDEYPYHVYLSQMTSWAGRWCTTSEKRREVLAQLLDLALEGERNHPFSTRLRSAIERTRREYLLTTVKGLPD